MVSQTGKYALRILGYLSDHPGQWIQGGQIASETGIPSNYLSKIMNQLRRESAEREMKKLAKELYKKSFVDIKIESF